MKKNMIILYAHPNKEGHCGAILRITEEELRKNNIEYELIDLYKLDYNPVLQQDEHYTSGHKNISEENKKYQSMIKDADCIMFIYPTWWNGFPAILKGFIDRVFVPGYAFYFKGKIPVGLLKGKKAVVITSTGAPRTLSRIVFKDISTKVLTRHILGFCGIKAKAFYISNAGQYSSKREAEIRFKVEKGFSYLGI